MRSEDAVRLVERSWMPPPICYVGQTVDELGRAVVSVLGELDVWSAPELREILEDLAERERATLLDLSATTFIDCAGVAVVLRAVAASERDGWSFVVADGAPPAVTALFDLARAHRAALSGPVA